MKHSLLSILACPEDKAGLTISVVEENQDEIISGSLTCSMCGTEYPISDGIPNLLPQSIRELQTD